MDNTEHNKSMDIQFNTPILLLICNRPVETSKVFERIRQLKPKHLFVSQDGTDKATADVIKIDWHCELHFRQGKRLGCKNGVISGIDWFFANVPEGIILEDDIVPDSTFFTFCEKLLKRYKDDKRIWHINGSNFQDEWIGNGSYYYSEYMHCWGWATYADRWKQFTEKFDYSLLPKQFKWLQKYLKQVENGSLDTWDYSWFYTILANKGTVIAPNVNMCENIGFNQNATHTKRGSHPKAQSLTDVLSPIYIERQADKAEYRKSQIEKWKAILTSLSSLR